MSHLLGLFDQCVFLQYALYLMIINRSVIKYKHTNWLFLTLQSKCTQKYVYERMLAYDPCDPYKGLFIDVFKFPSACSCHIPQPSHL